MQLMQAISTGPHWHKQDWRQEKRLRKVPNKKLPVFGLTYGVTTTVIRRWLTGV
jgi:hypothetical protein